MPKIESIDKVVEAAQKAPSGHSVMRYERTAGTEALGFTTDDLKALAAEYVRLRNEREPICQCGHAKMNHNETLTKGYPCYHKDCYCTQFTPEEKVADSK